MSNLVHYEEHLPDLSGLRDPLLIAGFGGAVFVEEDDSASVISGIFNALSEPFRASAQTQGR